jgi:hypothetical protein
MMEIKVRVTKQLYKAYDSMLRREKWIGRNMIKIIRDNYGK